MSLSLLQQLLSQVAPILRFFFFTAHIPSPLCPNHTDSFVPPWELWKCSCWVFALTVRLLQALFLQIAGLLGLLLGSFRFHVILSCPHFSLSTMTASFPNHCITCSSVPAFRHFISSYFYLTTYSLSQFIDSHLNTFLKGRDLSLDLKQCLAHSDTQKIFARRRMSERMFEWMNDVFVLRHLLNVPSGWI